MPPSSRPESGRSPCQARRRRALERINRRLGAQQIDLFGSPAVHGGNAPAWRELPSETQDVLVNLMTQLMLEHAQRQASATATVEASHDH